MRTFAGAEVRGRARASPQAADPSGFSERRIRLSGTCKVESGRPMPSPATLAQLHGIGSHSAVRRVKSSAVTLRPSP